VILVLLLVLLGLGYWTLARPQGLSTDSGQRDRNFLFSIYGFEGDLLRRPSSVDIAPNGEIHVADTGKRRVVVFDERGNYIRTYGEYGADLLQLQNPIDVAVAPDGRCYVLDKGEKKIVVYDPTGTPQTALTFEDWPLSITIANDRLYVTMPPGVAVFDLDFGFVTAYLDFGKDPGKFDKPGGVAVAEDGTIYVADSFNYRVQALKNGEVLWTYGEPLPPESAIQFNEESRKFGLPASIALDENGNLYVVDGTNSELVVLSSDGEFQQIMGGVGHDDGTFYYPDGIAYGNGMIAVADKFNDRVEIFRVPRPGVEVALRFAPWLALLLLPLLLIPLLLLRRTRHVVTGDFIDAMARDEEYGEAVAKALRIVYVPTSQLERGRKVAERLPLTWKSRDVAEDRAAEVAEKFGVTTADAEVLALALELRGKRIVLAESERTRNAATELELPQASYEELVAEEERKAADRAKAETTDEGANDTPADEE
jgi:hypothetical protein